MKWVKYDCNGNEQVWYSDDEVEKLKAENERLKQEWRLDCLKCEYKNTKADVDKYRKTLQEIKEIAEKELSYDMIGNEHRHYRNYDFIRHLITKAESEEE